MDEGLRVGPTIQECIVKKHLNCWKAKSKDMPISSQALWRCKEGSETRDTKVSPQRVPSRTDDDIVQSVLKSIGEEKSLREATPSNSTKSARWHESVQGALYSI